MSSRVNGTNRVLLTLLGLVLLAGGVLGLVLSYGGFGSSRAGQSVLLDSWRRFAADHEWFWWAVAGGCLVLAFLGLRWLLAQLRVDRASRVDLTTDDRDGVTTLHAGAFTEALTAEATGIRGVDSASAHLRGSGPHRLSLTVDLTDYADIAEVRSELESSVVTHARQALDAPDMPIDIELRPTTNTRRSLA